MSKDDEVRREKSEGSERSPGKSQLCDGKVEGYGRKEARVTDLLEKKEARTTE
jgi:hypothetical protein